MSYRILCRLLSFLFIWSLVACSENEDLYEELDKLRGLGVSSEPLVAKPSTSEEQQTVVLTVYAAIPLEEDNISAEIYEDVDSPFSPVISTLSLVDGSETYTDYTKFRVYTIQAQFVVPAADDIGVVEGEDSISLRYGIKLNSGDEEEKIVGNVFIRPEGSEELEWSAPTIEITEPASDATIRKNDEIDIKSEVNQTVDEDLKIGWFSSAGAIKNRRAAETEWETSGDDTQTIVATVRGKRSRGFSIQVLDLSAE